MQIHSSRLMFCHSALSAIKLAPVLKSPADNVAEDEIMLHFPCVFLHLHIAAALPWSSLASKRSFPGMPDVQLSMKLGFFPQSLQSSS